MALQPRNAWQTNTDQLLKIQTKPLKNKYLMKLKAYFSANILIGALAMLNGCSEVAPWERGNLAKPDMAITPNTNLNHFRDHIFTSREASQGGHSSGGGGCGCN